MAGRVHQAFVPMKIQAAIIPVQAAEFDQFTGATITPRAVVNAVRLALEYFRANRDMLFDTAPESEESTAP